MDHLTREWPTQSCLLKSNEHLYFNLNLISLFRWLTCRRADAQCYSLSRYSAFSFPYTFRLTFLFQSCLSFYVRWMTLKWHSLSTQSDISECTTAQLKWLKSQNTPVVTIKTRRRFRTRLSIHWLVWNSLHPSLVHTLISLELSPSFLSPHTDQSELSPSFFCC